MINRCPECGSWDAQCGSDEPNPTCGCKRCSHATITRLREAINGLYRSRKILDGKDDWVLISFDSVAWDHFVEIAREER